MDSSTILQNSSTYTSFYKRILDLISNIIQYDSGINFLISVFFVSLIATFISIFLYHYFAQPKEEVDYSMHQIASNFLFFSIIIYVEFLALTLIGSRDLTKIENLGILNDTAIFLLLLLLSAITIVNIITGKIKPIYAFTSVLVFFILNLCLQEKNAPAYKFIFLDLLYIYFLAYSNLNKKKKEKLFKNPEQVDESGGLKNYNNSDDIVQEDDIQKNDLSKNRPVQTLQQEHKF